MQAAQSALHSEMTSFSTFISLNNSPIYSYPSLGYTHNLLLHSF